ncbi:hypothetical protein [PinkBerry-associated phage LS06-2018-MD08]|nr:hypothetical protein [PinkBerry-associated phage LS06-2018-MD08]
MKSIQQRREEIKKRNRRERNATITATAIPLVTISVQGASIVVPNIQQVIQAKELAIQDDTFLKQFDKVRLSNADKRELRDEGFTPLKSSNIAGVKQQGDDLILKFHSGEEYIYPKKKSFFKKFAEALSPGRLLWNTIRYARGYRKI